MTDFEYEERLTRQRAAERLADLSYALALGATLEVRRGEERVTVPVADTVLLTRRSRRHGARVEVEVTVTWAAWATDRGPEGPRSLSADDVPSPSHD